MNGDICYWVSETLYSMGVSNAEAPDDAQVGVTEDSREHISFLLFWLRMEPGTFWLRFELLLLDKQGELSQWYIISSVFIQHFSTFDHDLEVLSVAKFKGMSY
jgi:hypothetical protein